MLWNQEGLWPLIFTVMFTVYCKQKSLDSVKPKPSNLFSLSIMTLYRVRPKGSNITGNVLLCKAMWKNPLMCLIHPWQDSTSVTTGQFHSLEDILDVGYASSTENSTGLSKWDNGGRQTFMNYWLSYKTVVETKMVPNFDMLWLLSPAGQTQTRHS